MQKVYEYVSSGKANSLLKMLAPILGISAEGWEYLGEGDNGIAFVKEDEIVKVTDDWSEAELYSRLENKNLPNMPKVYSFVEVDTGGSTDNKRIFKYTTDNRYVWLIRMERLSLVKMYQEVHRWIHDEDSNWFDHSQASFDKLIAQVSAETEEEDTENEDYVYFLEQLKQIHQSLNKINVKRCSDFKGGHAGYNSKDELCFFDLRIAEDLIDNLKTNIKKKVNIHSLQEAKKVVLKHEDVSIPMAAWIYLALVYDWEMKYDSWERDNRMGVTFAKAVEFFLQKDLCSIEGEKVIFNEKNCVELLLEKFGGKTIQDAAKKCYELKSYNREGLHGYPIGRIPMDLYFQLHPAVEKSKERLSDLMVDWFNHWSDRTMAQISKNRHLKELNYYNAFKYYYPEPIPAVLVLYRGLKNIHNEDGQNPQRNPYSSWTLDKKQGERFATYHFTGQFQGPHEAKVQTILKTEKNMDEILFFYGGDEAEVVLKNPVSNIEVIHKKGW